MKKTINNLIILIHMNIDVIIPCYNEEKTIESIIIESIKHLSTKDNLLIVDDGSTDKSNFLIKKL